MLALTVVGVACSRSCLLFFPFQAGLRESDMSNFRSLLKEEQDKLRIIEENWKGLLAGLA